MYAGVVALLALFGFVAIGIYHSLPQLFPAKTQDLFDTTPHMQVLEACLKDATAFLRKAEEYSDIITTLWGKIASPLSIQLAELLRTEYTARIAEAGVELSNSETLFSDSFAQVNSVDSAVGAALEKCVRYQELKAEAATLSNSAKLIKKAAQGRLQETIDALTAAID